MYHNILVLSGGGTRGVVSNQVLKYIEQSTRCHISELFQACYGTSTGFLQTCALTTPGGPSASGLDKLYFALAQKVFKKRTLAFGGWAGPMYDASVLEAQLREILGDHRLKDAEIPIGGVVYNLQSREPELWCSYGERRNESSWAASRASSAAQTFFAPYKHFTDGGTVANMPAAWGAVDFHRTFNVPFSQIRVLALGTGTAERPIAGKDGAGKIGWVEDVIDIAISGSQDLERILCESLGLGAYLELQVALPPGMEAMDNAQPEQLQRLATLGQQMVAQNRAALDAFLAGLQPPKLSDQPTHTARLPAFV